MAKYMLKVSYTKEGMQGLLKEGGSSRRAVADKLVSNMGGSLESFYFAFGDSDAYITCEMPNNVDASAVAMTVGAGGGATIETIVLMTPEEVDEATEKTVEYRPPGQ